MVLFIANMIVFVLGTTITPAEILCINEKGFAPIASPKAAERSVESDGSLNMLMRCVAMQSYLTFLLSAADLPLLALDRELTVEVLDRVISDAKRIFVCVWRHIEHILEPRFHQMHVVNEKDLSSWRSLFKTYASNGQRLAVLFDRLRNLNVRFTESIPEITAFPSDAYDRLEAIVKDPLKKGRSPRLGKSSPKPADGRSPRPEKRSPMPNKRSPMPKGAELKAESPAAIVGAAASAVAPEPALKMDEPAIQLQVPTATEEPAGLKTNFVARDFDANALDDLDMLSGNLMLSDFRAEIDQPPASKPVPTRSGAGTPDSPQSVGSSFPESETSAKSAGLTLPFAKPINVLADSFKDGQLSEREPPTQDSNAYSQNSAFNPQFNAGRYVIGNVLGKGAFGTVYRAFDTEEGTFVAVKELQLGRATDDEQMRELRAEFEVLTRAKDAHVVEVFGLDLSNPERPRIVMEWMSGGSIQCALKLTKNGFKESVAAFYIKQALLGLAFLHSQNIVHRDIKPGNMLLSANGKVKLSDFGTSRIINNMAATSMQTGTVVGTIPFLAPECFKGTYSTGSDVWAIGCSALEMLTGRMPWSECGTKDSLALVFIIGNAQPPEHHPQLPECVDETDSPLMPCLDNNSGLGSGHGRISEMARDFLMQCFTYDYKERPTAAQLLEHEFVKFA